MFITVVEMDMPANLDRAAVSRYFLIGFLDVDRAGALTTRPVTGVFGAYKNENVWRVSNSGLSADRMGCPERSGDFEGLSPRLPMPRKDLGLNVRRDHHDQGRYGEDDLCEFYRAFGY